MRVVVMMCGPLSGLSGGDVHALRLVAFLRERALLFAPEMMRRNLPPEAREALHAIRTPLDARMGGMSTYLLNVFLRMAIAIVRAPRSDVDVAAAHLFHDVLPCVFRRILRRNRLVVAFVYHLIEDERTTGDLRSRVSIWLERLSLALLRMSRALVLVDQESVREALHRRGFRDLAMTSNAYDTWLEIPPRSPSAQPSVVVLGRLTAEKGVWDALHVAAHLDAEVVLLGDGPLRDEVEARAATLRNVQVAGFVSEEEKWRRLRSAHLFLAPSHEEGWGIAVGEGLTAGIPVVAYDLPAYDHFGDAILRVPIGDVDALVRAARDALSSGDRQAELPMWEDILRADVQAIELRLASTR